MGQIFKLNGVDYDCEFTLTNFTGSVTFTKSAIREMQIIDNVFEPFLSGSVSIANPYNLMEDDFMLIGDGKDELTIKFKPVHANGYPDKGFDHTFVIIDDLSDIINPLTRSENIKNFNIVSKFAIPFSSMVPYGKKYKNDERIGNIIKKIFEELEIPVGQIESGEELGFDFIPPITYRYMDLLRYFLRIFCVKKNENYVKGFMNYNSDTQMFELINLAEIFENNKSYTIETFPVGDLVSHVGYENPDNPVGSETFPTGEYIGQLKNISHSTPMHMWNSEFFTSSLISGYDKKSGRHRMVKIKLMDLKDNWRKCFVEPFQRKGGEAKPFLFPSEMNKTFKLYKLPYPIKLSAKIVEAEMMTNLTLYNLNITFTNIGNPMRESSKFIHVLSPRKNMGDPYPKSDEKLLGIWYITEIHHVFNGDTYTNNIYANKTYVGDSGSQ